MFNREDYWPYVFGVFLFAGLLVIPFVYAEYVLPGMEEPFRSIPRRHVFIGSFVACGLFTFSHTRMGEVSLARLIGGVLIAVLVYLRFQGANLFFRENIIFVPVGLLGLALMAGGGWLGIGIARVTGIAAYLVPKDPTVLHQFGEETAAGEAASIEQASQTPEVVFDQAAYNDFLSRTRAAWLAGTYEQWQPGMKASAAKKETARFHELMQPAIEAICIAFARTTPSEDEVLITAEDGENEVSTVLTNRRFFFFETDPNRLFDRYPAGVVRVDQVAGCEVKEGFLSKGATLSLRSGEHIEVEGLKSPLAVRCIENMLKADAGGSDTAAESEDNLGANAHAPAAVLGALVENTDLPSSSDFIELSHDGDYLLAFGNHLVAVSDEERAVFFEHLDRIPPVFTSGVAQALADQFGKGHRYGLYLFAGAALVGGSASTYFLFDDIGWWVVPIALVSLVPLAVVWAVVDAQRVIRQLRRL